MAEIKVAVVGLGYWGPILARNFAKHPDTTLVAIVDQNPDVLKKVGKEFRNAELFTNLSEALPLCDAVAIATPVSTHFKIALESIQNGKHVFVEKAFTRKSEDAKILLEEAKKRNLVVAVDHILLYHGMIRKVKEIIDSGELGDILYFNATRANLGLYQSDNVNVAWDLGPHDLSMMLYFFGEPIETLKPAGASHLPAGLIDDVHLHFKYSDKFIASVYLSWLSPIKQRMAVIGGSKKMLVFSDLLKNQEIRIFDTGISVAKSESGYRYSYRDDGYTQPAISPELPLTLELTEFACAIRTGSPVTSDGAMGLKIVQMLEECDSLL